MISLRLVKIIDTSGKTTGKVNGILYQALTEKEEDNLLQLEGDYSYIGRDFQVEMLGEVQIPSMKGEE